MRNSEKKVRQRLIHRARELAAAGYSAIPIQGDRSGAEPKKAAVKWRAFQKRIADDVELGSLFDGRAGAIGVVCGQVSRLLVIDFDDHLRYQRFCRLLPQYADTYTVKTRRGFHIYFRTAEKIPTHQFKGGDIKAERSYVVAAPSVIGGFKYRAVNKHGARDLSKQDVERILDYFHVGCEQPQSGGERIEEPRDIDLVALYGRWSRMRGRNNALYRCALTARGLGMSLSDVERKLLRVHVEARTGRVHKRETYAARFSEGARTIASAFAGQRRYMGGMEGIPNSVREQLLKSQGSCVTARLLDILQVAGWQAESFFSMKAAIDLAERYGLNRKSVMSALTGDQCSFNGRHIIARRYVEYLDIGGLNVGKRGRPVQLVFQAPSVSRLLSVLDVGASPSDRLKREDLMSSQAYRRALHREYVKRLAPRLPMAVLADRLGLSARTLRRYNAQLGVSVRARIGVFGLTWTNLKCLPRQERGQGKGQTPGYWLAVGDGARFPAWRHMGAALLRQGGRVRVCVRRASALSVGDGGVRSTVYEAMNVESFMRLRLLRGERLERVGLLDQLRAVAREVSMRAGRLRYEKIRLQYDTVAQHIAEDKVAETISGYLYARDGMGSEVRRPARRGVAYRMLKEFGEGEVMLAVRDRYAETMSEVARHALRLGEVEAGAGLLARSMA